MNRKRHSGFTLLELLVVLVLMGLITGMAVPLLSSGLPGAQLKASARELLAGLRQARDQAITRRQDAALTIDVQKHNFQVTGDSRVYKLPAKVKIGLFVADTQAAGDVGAFRFYPDGSSTGGRVTVSLDRTTYRIDVDWLTGMARLQD
ncbi:hypothetical protein GALL_433900 [mine drainage metagenome]|uniref:General secretion pathway GspH domain-containing protein n=1 Tax=mine drainage metagenome TaxID=410659 RepID=A0A1J5QG59_9ZZZZ